MNLDRVTIRPIIDSLQLLKISDEVYFSEQYADYVSNSRLGLINPEQGGSPQKFFDGFAGNKSFSDSFIFGSAVHEQLLQPDFFEICESVNRPTGKVGFISDLLYNKNHIYPTNDEIMNAVIDVDYYHGILSESIFNKLKQELFSYFNSRWEYEKNRNEDKDIIYLDEKSREKFHECMDNLNNNALIQQLLHPVSIVEPVISLNENAIILHVEATVDDSKPFIVKLKSKLDNFTIDRECNLITVNDLKTHGRAIDIFSDSILNFHYYREIAMYSTLLSMVCAKYYHMPNPDVKGNFLVVSTIPPYSTQVFRMTKELFKKGIEEFHKLLKMVCYYTYYGFQDKEEIIL